MAFDLTGFMTIVGKHVKTINTMDGYIAATETLKNEIRDAYEAEDLHDLYRNLPGLIAAFQNSVTGSIRSIISDLNGLIFDRDYTTEQLNLYQTTLVGVLNALYDYMVENSDDIKSSVVSIGGSDTDYQDTAENSGLAGDLATSADNFAAPKLYCCRFLDGVNSPGNNVLANKRYRGVESQLARTTTVKAEIINNSTDFREVVQIYSLGPATGGYVLQDEEPGVGPTLLTAEGQNLISANYNFSSWTSNDPNSWTMAGGSAGTDWVDLSGSGTGPLRIKTVNVTAKQRLTGLQRERMYFVAVNFSTNSTLLGETLTVGVRIEDGVGTAIQAERTASAHGEDLGGDIYNQAYTFFSLPDTTDLEDVYVRIKLTARSDASNYATIHKVVLCPATYYNGLAWAWWAPIVTAGSYGNLTPLGSRQTMTVSNNNAGVFQTFFRKALNVQMPTADSPSISDSLAT
jgi:hypothetical protein